MKNDNLKVNSFIIFEWKHCYCVSLMDFWCRSDTASTILFVKFSIFDYIWLCFLRLNHNRTQTYRVLSRHLKLMALSLHGDWRELSWLLLLSLRLHLAYYFLLMVWYLPLDYTIVLIRCGDDFWCCVVLWSSRLSLQIDWDTDDDRMFE